MKKVKVKQEVYAQGQPGTGHVLKVDLAKRRARVRVAGIEDWYAFDSLHAPDSIEATTVTSGRRERKPKKEKREMVAKKKAETKKKKAPTKKEAKAGGGKRGIQKLLVELLSMKTVPPDEEIWRRVKKAFPESKFKLRHLRWYKNRYMHGALSGQEGKRHVIAQPKTSDGSATEAMGLPRTRGGSGAKKAKKAKAPRAKAKAKAKGGATRKKAPRAKAKASPEGAQAQA